MSEEFLRLSYELIKNMDCICDRDIEVKDLKLQPAESTESVFQSDYVCDSCGREYDLKISEAPNGQMLSADVWLASQEESGFPLITSTASKWSLYEQAHPAADLVQSLFRLTDALVILEENENRLQAACDVQFDEYLDMEASEQSSFLKRIATNIHNYLSSAYSFEETYKNFNQESSERSIQRRETEFEKQHRVIGGLRIFAQHQHAIPFSITQGQEDDSVWVRIEVDQVDSIPSASNIHPPDGYRLGAEHHYSDVSMGVINLNDRAESHFNSAERLVEAVIQESVEQNETDVEHYLKRISPTYHLDM